MQIGFHRSGLNAGRGYALAWQPGFFRDLPEKRVQFESLSPCTPVKSQKSPRRLVLDWFPLTFHGLLVGAKGVLPGIAREKAPSFGQPSVQVKRTLAGEGHGIMGKC